MAPNGFIAAGFAAPGLAAAGFDSVAARTGDFAEPGDFNGFDAALCDVAEGVFPGFLVASWIDLLADARRVFEGDVFADVFDAARVAFPDDGLGDFLRVFLDIRLPFVAFGRSIMGYCGSCPGEPEVSRLLGKADGLGVWLPGIRHTIRPLVECAPWA